MPPTHRAVIEANRDEELVERIRVSALTGAGVTVIS
jgi:hypothetical protein